MSRPLRLSAQAWFRRYRATPPEPRLRLVCFPPAGSAPNLFCTWSKRLPTDVDLLAVRYPGRQDRLTEPCVDRMDILADLITNALTSFDGRPVALFGHSMGALVAYEVAVRLEKQHRRPPARLFVSAHMAPDRMKLSGEPTDDEALIAEVRSSATTGSEILDNEELRALVMPAIRADHRLLNTYRPATPNRIGAPIVGYVGVGDPLVSPEDVAAWARLTTTGFELRTFPGEHFYLTFAEAELIADLRRHLDPVRT